MRRSVPILLAMVFVVIALLPLSLAFRALTDASFHPPWPIGELAFASVVFLSTGLAWLLASTTHGRLIRWLILGGSLFGLYIGAYGIWGAAVLNEPCQYGTAVAALATSWPAGFCGSEGHQISLSVMYVMVGVGIASVGSFATAWWLRRNRPHPALD